MKKHLGKLLSVALAAMAVMVMGASAASAATPAPGYERFAGCPSPSENPAVTGCIRSVITSGHFKMGSKNVPISKPITLSGGVNSQLGGFTYNSKGGLTPVQQPVPGGVIGWTGLDWLVNFLDIDALQLFAVTEAVGPPTFGETLHLPIRVRLVNPVLGSKCYIGSPTNPITLNLTEGTTSPPPPNKPITGKQAEFAEHPTTGVTTLKNAVAVDNSFAAPGANGCTLTLFGFIPISINGLVNAQSGLPSPAGTNETVQTLDTELVPSNRVYP
jgi:hypothetical protein